MGDYKEYIEKRKKTWVGMKVLYQGEVHTVVDVDYNGMFLIDKPSETNSTTAVSPSCLD